MSDLEAKYPCPSELEWAKHFLYKPVVFMGYFVKKYLMNGGEKNTKYDGWDPHDKKNQWIVYPLSNGMVCLKSVLDGYNLGIHVMQEVGWSFVSSSEQIVETQIQQFKMWKATKEGFEDCFLLKS